MMNTPLPNQIIREITPLSDKDCFYIAERYKTEFTYPIHNHSEFELNFTEKAAGVRRIVGDSSEVIGDYDLVLITGKELEHRLDDVYITANKNAIPNDPEKPFVTSGLRLGTAAATTRGLQEEDMDTIADCIKLAATEFDAKADEIRARVNAICEKYPLYR